MSLIFNIERFTSNNKLGKVQYQYYDVGDLDITLAFIMYYKRKSRRHKWKGTKMWFRGGDHENDMPYEEPPQDVKDEVVRKIVESINFV